MPALAPPLMVLPCGGSSKSHFCCNTFTPLSCSLHSDHNVFQDTDPLLNELLLLLCGPAAGWDEMKLCLEDEVAMPSHNHEQWHWRNHASMPYAIWVCTAWPTCFHEQCYSCNCTAVLTRKRLDRSNNDEDIHILCQSKMTNNTGHTTYRIVLYTWTWWTCISTDIRNLTDVQELVTQILHVPSEHPQSTQE